LVSLTPGFYFVANAAWQATRLEGLMHDKIETHPLLQGWAEEFEEAREVFGVVGALLYFCLLVVLAVVALFVVLVLGALALALLPLAAVIGLAVMRMSRWQQSSQVGEKPPPLDPWLME
jgi:hypothetical protein